MSEWKKCKLGEILTDKGYIRGPFGSSLKRGEMKETGITVYEQKNAIYNSREFRFFVDKEKFKELSRFQVKTNDLIISCSGTVGKISIIKEEDPKGIISQALLILRPDINKVTLKYLYYFLSSRQGYDLITQASHGSVQVNIAERKVVENIPLLLPPLPEQRAIASVLSSLDDKIDLLHRQNKTLEAMAETLFRQWFVEEADEGWEKKTLSSIAEHKKYNVKPDQNPATIYRHYSIPAFDDGKQPIKELGSEIKSNKYQVVPNSILISKLNPRFPRVWAITDLMDENSICSTEFQVVYPTQTIYYGFIYCLLKSKQVTEELIGAAGGTSGSHQRVKPEDVFNLSFQMPSDERIGEFNLITCDHLKKVSTNMKQIRTLEKLRDTLLPKLMSGEVRIQYRQEVTV